MSRAVESAEAEGNTVTAVGPVRWMCPTAMMRRVYSPKSDVFSFGNVLFELFVQRIPWHKLDARGAATKVLAGERLSWPSKRSIPPQIVELADRCFAFEPADRPAMVEVQQQLEQIIEKEY